MICHFKPRHCDPGEGRGNQLTSLSLLTLDPEVLDVVRDAGCRSTGRDHTSGVAVEGNCRVLAVKGTLECGGELLVHGCVGAARYRLGTVNEDVAIVIRHG